jgi:hypothetical protein
LYTYISISKVKTASIYKKKGKGYIIFGSSKTISGLRIAVGPFINIQEVEASTNIIVRAIKACLCNSNEKFPNPKSWAEFNKDFLQKIGLKSLKELENADTKLVSINQEKGNIIFNPMQPAKKPDKGFINTNTKAVEVSEFASDQEILKAYELALSSCG